MPKFYKYGREWSIKLINDELRVKDQKLVEQFAAIRQAEMGKLAFWLSFATRLASGLTLLSRRCRGSEVLHACQCFNQGRHISSRGDIGGIGKDEGKDYQR